MRTLVYSSVVILYTLQILCTRGGDVSFETTSWGVTIGAVSVCLLGTLTVCLTEPITYVLYVVERYSHTIENVGLQCNPGSLRIENISPHRGRSGPDQIRVNQLIPAQLGPFIGRRGSHGRHGVS